MSKEVQCKNCPQLRDGWECEGEKSNHFMMKKSM
jgi:hypothetical protein